MTFIEKSEPPKDVLGITWILYWLRVVVSVPVRLLASVMLYAGMILGVIALAVLLILAIGTAVVLACVGIGTLFVASLGVVMSPHDLGEFEFLEGR